MYLKHALTTTRCLATSAIFRYACHHFVHECEHPELMCLPQVCDVAKRLGILFLEKYPEFLCSLHFEFPSK
jgi:hypothetical protein